LLERDSLRSSVNRAYYAAYHAVRALLASEGVNPKTHKGVLTMFGEKFIKTGKIGIEFSDALKGASMHGMKLTMILCKL